MQIQLNLVGIKSKISGIFQPDFCKKILVDTMPKSILVVLKIVVCNYY